MAKKKKIGEEQIRTAIETLKKYRNGKTNLDSRIIRNEQWWKMRHWDEMRSSEPSRIEPTSGWMFNAIANKHADAMDNYPSANILPRAEDDRLAAEKLAAVIPAILDANHYEQVYSDTWWYKLKQGTGVKGVFWDSNLSGGLGDVAIRRIDLLNCFWEPGVTDIQKSPNFFTVELRDNEILREEYPDIDFNGNGGFDVGQYIFDDTVDTSDKSPVIDWYYKKLVNGVPVLHYCKFVNENLLYASENEKDLAERGFYDHGLYPFVFDPLYPEEGTPAGFGMIDICKSNQEYIDKLDKSILENALISSKKRFFVRNDGGISEEEFANLDNPFIHSDASLGDDSIKEIVTRPLSNIYYNIKQGKIDELKETSGNRDFSQGATTSGVTAASAIAALQEAGSKLSRDMLKASYRAFANECYLIIELIRQFYDEPRVFRITGSDDSYAFVTFDNSEIIPQSQGEAFGIDLGSRLPVFDIKVSVEKQSNYSRITQNELALQLYGQGFFAPQNATAALSCLEMMDFEGRQNVIKMVSQGDTMFKQMQQMQQQMMQLMQIVDRQNGTNMTEAYMNENPATDANGGSAPKPNLDVHKTLAQKSRDIARGQASPV